MEIKGQCEERFESVRDIFEELHDSKREKGYNPVADAGGQIPSFVWCPA